MKTLQWTLGTGAALFALGWTAFFVFANTFRRSIGAMPNPRWTGVVPVVVALLLLLSVIFPNDRIVLLLTGIVVIGASVAAMRILRAAPVLAAIWFGYATMWMTYCAMALQMR